MTETWRDFFGKAVARKDAALMRQAVDAGLPLGEYLFGFEQQHTALLEALDRRGGVAVVVEVLIAAGADVNQVASDRHKQSPLCLAARRGDLASVRCLLAAGANVAYANASDSTPLSWATMTKKPAHEAVVKALLAAGARPNYQAVVWAAHEGTPAMLEMLAAAGADLNEVSRWGTALILAVAHKRLDTTEALLRLGADVNLRVPETHRNYPGKTALDVAKDVKAKKLFPMLEAAMTGQLPSAPTPKPLDDVPKLFKRIFKGRAALKKSLRKGATEEQLAACEAALGVTLPADLRAVYLAHDGQKPEADGLFPEEFADLDAEFVLLSLEEMLQEWTTWKQLADSGEFAGQESKPDAGVRADWWNPRWIPFAGDGGGDSLCIDLDPATGGTVGQVILHQHADTGRVKIALGVQALLNLLAEYLEEGESDPL